MEPPGKRKTLSAICEYLQIKAVSSRGELYTVFVTHLPQIER